MHTCKEAVAAMNRIFLLGALFFLSLPVSASELEIIVLKHRSAEEVLPIIRPLLDQDAVASGMNYQLFLRTSPRNLEQVRKLLESIDTAPRRLKITVMQNVDSETIARLTGVSGSVGVGRHGRVIVPGSGTGDGLNVEAGRGRDRLSAQLSNSRSLEEDHKTQQLQVLEGNRALVRSGENVPVPQRQVIHQPWGTQVIESTQYQEVSSGFYVLPRVNGDRVTLEISTQNDSVDRNEGHYPDTHIQQTSSTVSGRLGEWLEVGVLGQQQSSNDSTISTRSASQMHEQRSVLIKVEEVK